MAVERGGADADRARDLAQAEIVGGAVLEQRQPGLDRRRAQIAMMVGLFDVDTVIFRAYVNAINI